MNPIYCAASARAYRAWRPQRLGHAEACVGELADELGWGMPTISQRLKVLHQEELQLHVLLLVAMLVRGRHLRSPQQDALLAEGLVPIPAARTRQTRSPCRLRRLEAAPRGARGDKQRCSIEEISSC